MAFSEARKELDCSVCLNIYTDPVTLKCGHNFCCCCIERVLDAQGRSGVYCCPECREEFQERPELQRNITLRNIVKSFRCAEPEQKEMEIFCTYCIHSPVPAVKSCVHCEASLCDNHLKVHSKSPQHVLCDLTHPLESGKCSIHKKILEYYCSEDSACLCGSCKLHGDHQEHQVNTLEEASEKRKEKLANALQKLLKDREEMEQNIESLKKHKRKVQDSAAGVTKRATALFRDIRRQLDILERRVMIEISRQADKDSFPASDLIQEMEIKNNELSRKIQQIEEICKMSDPLSVLQESDTGDLCDMENGDNKDKVRHDKLLHGGQDLEVAAISHTLYTGLSDILKDVYGGNYILEPEGILLNVDTAHNYLHISDDRKVARRVTRKFNRLLLIERFQGETEDKVKITQVLGSQSFSSGRHYWDVDVGGSSYWSVGVCYSSMNRTDSSSELGRNNVSRCLTRNSNELSVKYNSQSITIPGHFLITRVRIFLDYEAGQVSFFELGVPIRHLHTFTQTFTQALHAAVFVGEGCIKICRGNHEM